MKIEETPGQPIEGSFTSAWRFQSDLVSVSSLLSKTTLDAIGLTALGAQFDNLVSPTEFALAFERVFGMETSIIAALMSAINIYFPIRGWLPIKVNRDYLNANWTIRRLLREHIRKRKIELASKGKASEPDADLLALMIREKDGGVDPWTEDEMLNHVRTS